MSTRDARWVRTIIFALAMTQSATARPLPVMNPGFEQPALADRAFTAVPDWVRYEMLLAVDDNSLSPEEGTFLESVLTYSSPPSGPVVGESLTIRLIGFPGPGLEVDFDDVRLDAVSADGPSVDLRIVAFERLSTETFSITWLSEPGALYEIRGADTPDGMFVALRTDIEGAAGTRTTATFTDPNAVEHAARFYVVSRSASPQAE